MHLLKPRRLGTSRNSDTNTDELGVRAEEGHDIILFVGMVEYVRVGDHVEAHEEMQKERPFNDATRLVCQV